jgi:hypothetical protein
MLQVILFFLYVHKAFTRSRMSFNEIESRENVFLVTFRLNASYTRAALQLHVSIHSLKIESSFSLEIVDSHLSCQSAYMCDYSQLSS